MTVRARSLQAAQDGLVADNEDVLLPLELHDDGLEPDDNVAVRLAATVAVVELVLVAIRKVIWVRELRGRAVRLGVRVEGALRTSISSYVIPSHTPASSSSSDFHVSLLYGRCCAVWMVRCSVDVHTCACA